MRVIDAASEMEALGPAWETLQDDTDITSIFASFDWQHLWWRSYGRGRRLRLLTASERDRIVGILPMYIDTTPVMRYPVRVLRLVGAGGDTSPDDLGPLLARGRELDVAQALADAVLRLAGWDVLSFKDMQPGPFTKVMLRACERAGLDCEVGRSERISYLDLPGSYEDWLKSLHGDRRYRVRKLRKRINAAHAVRFHVWNDPATLDQGIDRLVELHRKRWQRAGQDHGFSTPAYVGFHRAVMTACMARDRLRLYGLDFGDQTVAMFYFYKFRDRVYLFQTGFDPDHGELKPGQALLGYIIEHAIGEGHKVLDFLRGEHQYKDELATGERETVLILAFRPRPGAWIYRVRRIILPALKARALEALARARERRAKARP